jgi:hypothetical protein
MPLLMCPNDNSPMSTVDRSGVQFDMCPTCRGVWLDRGEMEKLMDAARTEGAQQGGAPQGGPGDSFRPKSYPPQALGGYRGERGEHGEWGERGEHGERGHYGRKRSIFDIFD